MLPRDPRRLGAALLAAGTLLAALSFELGLPWLGLGLGAIAAGMMFLSAKGPARTQLPPFQRWTESGWPGRGRPAKMDYRDGLPAWPVKVVHPSRFADVPYEVEFASFHLPSGAILACLLRLYDIPESPYFLHRVFDVGAGPVGDYLRSVAETGEWMLALESRGTEPDLWRVLKVDTTPLRRLLEEAERHNRSLREPDGLRAVEEFLEAFEPEAERAGCEAGWAAVRRRLGEPG